MRSVLKKFTPVLKKLIWLKKFVVGMPAVCWMVALTHWSGEFAWDYSTGISGFVP
jgi:hypothetical protein